MEVKVLESQNEIYSKEKLLGEGAFGKAYLVRKKQTGQLLVIKQMNIDHMSKTQKEQTIKEAQILRSMSHPNIVKFHEVYLTKQNKLKIVMEYAEQGDLNKAIHAKKNKKSFFQEEQILDWFTQICLAIKHVHDRKILHRDIKGQNIFIGANNILKLGDFGIARVLNKTMDKARTVVGTPYYLSPEIIQNKPYSFKSDIWSMGVVLYEICALTHPFTAQSLQFLALKIVKGSYSPLQNNYSKQLKFLVSQMLQLDPNKRPSVNQILQKPLILSRVKNFLTETKRNIEFSHTVLHNQKVELSNKLVQKAYSVQKDGNQIQQQRQKLKERQAQIQKQLLAKKQSQRRASQQKRDREKQQKDREKRLEQAKKRQQEQKKRMIAYQQQKKQQMQRQYEQRIKSAQVYQSRIAQQRRQQQLLRQRERLMQEKYDIEQQRHREREQRKIEVKKLQIQQKEDQFKQAARKQYFENLEIKKRAQQRARKQQMGDYYDHPQSTIIESPTKQEKLNYQSKKRPSSRGNQRQGSKEKNSAQREMIHPKSGQQPARVKKDINEEDLQNAFLNPNFQKRSRIQQKNKQIRPPSGNIQKMQELSKQQAQQKYDESRQKMRKDRQKYISNMRKANNQFEELPNNKNIEIQQPNIDVQTVRGAKWQKRPRRSSKKSDSNNGSPKGQFAKLTQPTVNDAVQPVDSPRFGNSRNQQSSSVIRDSENLFIDIRDEGNFNKYLEELQNLVDNVNKKVEALPDIPFSQQIAFRDDDTQQLQFSLTHLVSPASDTLIKMSEEAADFDYFSDYSKLETLRIELEQAFGTQNFIKIYRAIQKEIQDKGLQNFDVSQVISNIGDVGTKTQIIMQNLPLLLTLVAMQDNMSY